ncbi:Reverse transcriptase domain-containing protein [Strongyloides ratti]|uniref:Reverse transcriptase domain-containing protein n=1 Tax=Strongyloides ratti TaxID=34506 RepID=A0A090KVK5_STRRB|nr:Reverse transcriptase domain-containing protein [Strongyloides ratti]CEF61456.1 Reverse transcriptase domain-containing protein [Strongyloides ratti]
MEPYKINDSKSSIRFDKLGNHDLLVWIEATTTRIQLVVNPDQQLEKFLSLLPKKLQSLIIVDNVVTCLSDASSILRSFLGDRRNSLPNELNCTDKEAEVASLLLTVLRSPTHFVKDWLKEGEVVNLESLKNFELTNHSLLTKDEQANKKKPFVQQQGEKFKLKLDDKPGFLVSYVPKWCMSVVFNEKSYVNSYLDSGAGFNYIFVDLVKQWALPMDENDTIKILQLLGASVHCYGSVILNIKIGAHSKLASKFYVLEVSHTIIGLTSVELLDNYVPKIIPYRKITNVALAKLTKRKLQEEVDSGCYVKVPKCEVLSAHPIVAIPKKESVCICENYTYLNKFIEKPSSMELVNIQSVLAIPKHKLRYLSELDISNAFFKPLREVFGISSISILFEQELYNLFQDLQIIRYLDDLFIYGKSLEKHNHSLFKCKEIMSSWNLPVNETKKQILALEIDFLRFTIGCDGSVTAKEKYKPYDLFKSIIHRFFQNNEVFVHESKFMKIVPQANDETVYAFIFCDNQLFYSSSRVLQNSE